MMFPEAEDVEAELEEERRTGSAVGGGLREWGRVPGVVPVGTTECCWGRGGRWSVCAGTWLLPHSMAIAPPIEQAPSYPR
jgi:hypothetical protein